MSDLGLLSGVKRKLAFVDARAAVDPKRKVANKKGQMIAQI
jgi:hypothetical protein